jgi:predicted dehydrogenase
VPRFAVVGVGANVFNMHAPALQSSGQIEIAAVCDVNLAAAERQAERFGCPYFADHREMLAAVRPEAVSVLAPHPFHATIAIDCLHAGAHVLVEKPIAVHVAEADRMIDAAAQAGRLLAVNLQHRTRGEIRTAKKLIESGRLGQIQRVEMVAIWTRTARYYAQAGWRGTWQGEGGGVLMNQSPHSLDLVCHLVGQPSRVVAWNRTVFHQIETEDTSLAMLEWSAAGTPGTAGTAATPATAGAAASAGGAASAAGADSATGGADGALGTLLVSTAQMGEPERLEIAGTRGVLQLTRGGLHLLQADTDLRTFLAESPEPFGKPSLAPHAISVEPGSGDHQAIYANFLDAITHGTPLVADGAQGRLSLELANALIYSSATKSEVRLPLDRAAYADLLDRLRAPPPPRQSPENDTRDPS